MPLINTVTMLGGSAVGARMISRNAPLLSPLHVGSATMGYAAAHTAVGYSVDPLTGEMRLPELAAAGGVGYGLLKGTSMASREVYNQLPATTQSKVKRLLMHSPDPARITQFGKSIADDGFMVTGRRGYGTVRAGIAEASRVADEVFGAPGIKSVMGKASKAFVRGAGLPTAIGLGFAALLYGARNTGPPSGLATRNVPAFSSLPGYPL